MSESKKQGAYDPIKTIVINWIAYNYVPRYSIPTIKKKISGSEDTVLRDLYKEKYEQVKQILPGL